MEKNVEGMKIILRDYPANDLNMLSEIAISYEQYEICQAVRDTLKEKGIKEDLRRFCNKCYLSI
jgi:hypothetical protein